MTDFLIGTAGTSGAFGSCFGPDNAVSDWCTWAIISGKALVSYGGNWVIKLVSAKYNAVEAAWRVVDTALDVAGGFGIFKQTEIDREINDKGELKKRS